MPAPPPSIDVSLEIQSIFEKNKLEDLKRFMAKRQCLNSWNMGLIYLFTLSSLLES